MTRGGNVGLPLSINGPTGTVTGQVTAQLAAPGHPADDGAGNCPGNVDRRGRHHQ